MRKYNFPLILGALIITLILVVMIFPQVFTDKNPYNMERIKFSRPDGKLEVETAPFPPSESYLLGSDGMGRDVFSRIIYGTRLTITLGILIALGRFLLAVPMALSAGFGSEASKSIIKQFNIVFSAIPAILISMIILSLDFFMSLDKIGSIIAFVIVLSVVSWANLSGVILERVEFINKQSFIRGEIAIGKKRNKIARENVIPHLAPELIVLFFMEIARALSMIMQLGIFSVFIGNLKIILSSDEGNLVFANVSFEPEWASMLSTSRSMLYAAPWSLIYPALAFFISVLGFNLVGEGLRNVMQERDSKAVPIVRKILSFDIIRAFKTATKKTKIKALAVLCALISIFSIQYFYNESNYKFEIEESRDIPYEQVIIGTSEAKDTADIIVSEMERLNIKPMEDEEYILEYGTGRACINLNSSFTINSGSGMLTPEINTDYSFVKSGDFDYTGVVYDATLEDLYNLSNFERFDEKFILIDKVYYNDALIYHVINEIDKNSSAKGILLCGGHDEDIENYILNESDDMFVLAVSNDLKKTIIENIDSSITVSAKIEPLEQTGKNIIGMYEGNSELAEEAILIGMRYNYLEDDGAEILQFNLELMDRLCTLYENKRSIIFMFIDGTISKSNNGMYVISEDFPYQSSKIEVYIDLTDLSTTDFDELRFSRVQAPYTRQFAWSIGKQLGDSFEQNRIDIDEYKTMFIDNEHLFIENAAHNSMFWERGVPTVVIGTENEGRKHDLFDLGKVLLEVINKNNY